ncbi:MAG: hypothetical protein V4634_14850 [Pseudomonadota bacterium]
MNPVFSQSSRRLVLAIGAMAALSQLAIAQEPSQRPNPLDAQAVVPPVVYQSTLQHYRPFADQEVSPWKESNDNTARVGGWRAYARQAQEPDASDARPAAKDAAVPDQAKPVELDKMGHTK